MNTTTVLIVDDNTANRAVLCGLLKDHYKVLVAVNGAQALEYCQLHSPDIVLLDIMMPEMDGYEVCRRLKSDPKTQAIPVIFLTAKSDIEDEQQGFDVGAVDYILKPISPPILLARVATQLRLKRALCAVEQQNQELERKVSERTHELEQLQDATINAMASLAETRDNETGNHIRRTQHYVRLLATELAATPEFQDSLTPPVIEALYKSAPLHDIGKVGIPDNVLLKPDKLTDEEFDIMKTHTTLGRDVIEMVEHSIDFESEFLRFAKEIAYAHQEKWDGSGYPKGLQGDEIPLSARLMAVADVYDALISKRVYKPPLSHQKAVEIINEGSDQHFDPRIVTAFMAVEQKFEQVALAYHDDSPELQSSAC